ncbi:prephenate dehydratase [Allofranklinella schreckenbergeri]|uniref:Bifunctional chorismate mutase/prephenate dehydratase n=1 Tax=Allofranklinella schreckenbergeri TaxID=1076744 RepID=A0A3M6Q820_9BURK|nr:prephenate dehydratase [Allofranklinella schreckenbergeri]RMW98581.1 prephenate dehydratase [Allofranklinella schreckenbergeri]
MTTSHNTPPSPEPVATPELLALRQRIDALDRQLLETLNERAKVAQEVGELKKKEGTTFFRPDRVAQVISKITNANPGPLKTAHVAGIWREITSACLALESPQRVAVLGPTGTFCEQAALEYFGGAADFVYCNSFDEVFHVTLSGNAQFGVVGLENSNEGMVTRTLDLLLQSPVHMVGEVSLQVRHNLLRLREDAEGIEAVLAHPQALAQCHAWLAKHLPHAERRPVSSNAEGARLAATNPAWAGLASARAAAQFGLHIVAPAIQDDAHNRTRFAIITLPQTMAMPEPSGRDATSLVIAVPNRPGAVHDLLEPLKKHGVSMTRFESRPARTGQWEYYFYIDLDGHPQQPHVAAALEELKNLSAFFRLLGAYPIKS